MMEDELRELLNLWDVEEEYIANFEKQKIKKVSTMLLLNERSIEKLFPEEGPLCEFLNHLKEFKKSQSSNVLNELAADKNGNFISKPSSDSEIRMPIASVVSDVLPDVIFEGEELLPPNKGGPVVIASSPLSPQVQVAQLPSPQINASPPEKASSSTKSARQQDNPSAPVHDPEDKSYDLERLLKSCLNGRIVWGHYEQHKSLTDYHRNHLADVIISDYLNDNMNKKLTFDTEKAMTSHVLKLFPSEKMEIWQSPKPCGREKASGRGKFVVRYYHIRRVLFKNNLLHREREERPSEISDEDTDQLTEEDQAAIDDAIQWLKNNKQNWSKVTAYWELTSKKRTRDLQRSKLEIHEYMLQYPALSEPTGYFLIESDFEILHKHCSMKLHIAWPILSTFILSKVSRKLQDEINGSLTPEGKKVRTLRALPYLFPVLTAVKKGKRQWRPSRIECQESLIMHVLSEADLQSDLASKRAKYQEFGLKMGPQAVMVGQDEDHITTAYISINNILYEVDGDAFKAFDLTFKALHALDAEYNREILREYQFLQKAVFGIPFQRGSKPDLKVTSLIEEYANFKDH